MFTPDVLQKRIILGPTDLRLCVVIAALGSSPPAALKGAHGIHSLRYALQMTKIRRGPWGLCFYTVFCCCILTIFIFHSTSTPVVIIDTDNKPFKNETIG